MRLGVLLAVMLTAAATAMSASSASSSTQIIRLISTSPQVDFNDTGKRGLSQGDTMVIRTSLFNDVPQFGKRKGARVGRSIVSFKFTSDTAADAFGTFWLPPGRLGYEGHYKQSGPVVYRVFGDGRGVWANARGTRTGKKLPGKDRELQVIRLSVP